MEGRHKKLLEEMLKEGVSEAKVVKYFVGEGYFEEEVIRDLAALEQSNKTNETLKDIHEDDDLVIPKACMDYKHMVLMKKMIKEEVEKPKLIEYFLKEGYTKDEVRASYYYTNDEIKSEEELRNM